MLEPRLYTDLASWWPLLSPPAEYAEETAIYRQILLEGCDRRPATLLELGSGGGNNASHLKAHFQMTLVDRSPGMLAVSRALNPECEHLAADMRTVRLNRQFDAVFVHDAVMHLTTQEDLDQAVQTAFVHCRPGGAALFCPDFTSESFRPTTDHGGCDEGSRGLRYLEWIWDPDPNDTTCIVDVAYLLRDGQGLVTAEYDRYFLGLFARAVWLQALGTAGFKARIVPFEHSAMAPRTCELFLGTRPLNCCMGRVSLPAVQPR
jgi:SAM-dependent methyltransferase